MSDAASFLTIALQAVSSRATVILALTMNFGLYCWAMWMHEPIALWTAGAFSVLVFLPVLFKGSSHEAQS